MNIDQFKTNNPPKTIAKFLAWYRLHKTHVFRQQGREPLTNLNA